MNEQPASQATEKSDEVAARQQKIQQALNLRRRGATYPQIASALGVARSTAVRMVKYALAQAKREADALGEMILELEIDRLDALLRAVWPRLEDGNLSAEQRLKACDRVLAISARRAKLLGLDAPEKVAPVTLDGSAPYVNPTDEERAAKIVELLSKARSKSDKSKNESGT